MVFIGMTTTKNAPIEALERHYPMRVLRYRLRQGSGGAGLCPGGEGIERDLLMFEDVTVSLITERRVSRPWGLAGGEPGAPGENWAAARRGRDPGGAAAGQVHDPDEGRGRAADVDARCGRVGAAGLSTGSYNSSWSWLSARLRSREAQGPRRVSVQGALTVGACNPPASIVRHGDVVPEERARRRERAARGPGSARGVVSVGLCGP